MLGFFESIHIDSTSFWIGCAAATLFWFFFQSLRKYFPILRDQILENSRNTPRAGGSPVEDRYRKEILRKAQSTHLAAPFCALDDLFIQPRLLIPPLRHEPGTPFPPEEILTIATAYLPDWPEISTHLGEHTLSIQDAFSSGYHLAITGQPGAGKSTLLAGLVSAFARKDGNLGDLSDRLPIYLHVGDILLPEKMPADPLQMVLETIWESLPAHLQSSLSGLIRTAARNGKIVFILDGLDELPVIQHQVYTHLLADFQKAYPSVRMVVSATPDYLGDLQALNFYPFAIAAWTQAQSAQFLAKWEAMWQKSGPLQPENEDQDQNKVEALLLNHWLLAQKGWAEPFTFTLMTWAAYAGDIRGARGVDAIQVYLERVIPDRPSRQVIEFTALNAATSGATLIDPAQVASLFALAEPEKTSLGEDAQAQVSIQIPRLFTVLAANGLLIEHSRDCYSFTHPNVLGYLAAQAIHTGTRKTDLFSIRRWTGRTTTLRYLAAREHSPVPFQMLIDEDQAPFYQGTFEAATWLEECPSSAAWRGGLLRRLVDLLEDQELPLAVRQKAMAALVFSRDTGLPILFRQRLQSEDAFLRQICSLACGLLQDSKSLPDLTSKLDDPIPAVRYAACLSISLFPARDAQETLTGLLYTADEDLRRAIAESMARNPATTNAILKEASLSEDLLARRASVYGLIHLSESWVDDRLLKMSIEDDQWVVRNAAEQAIQARQQRLSRVPHSWPPPAHSPWLITFAASQGTGIQADSPAVDILIQALQKGSGEERIAALEYLKEYNDSAIQQLILDGLHSRDIELREACYWALYQANQRGDRI